MNMPVVVEKGEFGERQYGVTDRLMQDRVILIDSEVSTTLAHIVSAQLLYLDSRDKRDITIYINSPGGSVHDGLKIADTIEACRSDVITVCTGLGASMGCFLTSIGTPGKRYMTRRATLMAHQVSSGTKGLITDQEISLQHSKHLNEVLMKEMAKRCGVTHKQLLKDCDRDFWMTAEQARDYGTLGFVDGVFTGLRNANDQQEIEMRNGVLKYVG